MKKSWIFAGVLVALIVIGVVVANRLEPLAQTAGGMGAKLGCSAHFLTGLDEAQVIDDLKSYTAAYGLISLAIDREANQAKASLFGMGSATASYRPGLGCTLDRGNSAQLDELDLRPLNRSDAPWPLGDTVNTIEPEAQQRVEALIAADNEAGLQTRALVIVRDGRVVGEAYAGGFDAFTPQLGWSMGKSVISLIYGHLALTREVDVQGSALFPEWQDERRTITLENLLHMSSGLAFKEVYAPGSDATKMLFAADDGSRLALTQPLAHPPGSHFAYSSGTTNLLSRLLMSRLGGTEKAVAYVRQHFFAPLGLVDTTLEVDPSGVFVGSSYIYASARDWARLGQLVLADGTLNEAHVVDAAWLARSAEPNTSANAPDYGYQFWLNQGAEARRWPDLPEDAFSMSGNRGQFVMIVPSENTVLIRLGWSAKEYPLSANFARLLGRR